MKVEIRLFATFREFLPPGSTTFSFTKELEADATVQGVIEALKLPEHVPKIIIVNGIHAGSKRVLQEGDVLSLFPPIAGG